MELMIESIFGIIIEGTFLAGIVGGCIYGIVKNAKKTIMNHDNLCCAAFFTFLTIWRIF